MCFNYHKHSHTRRVSEFSVEHYHEIRPYLDALKIESSFETVLHDHILEWRKLTLH